MAGINDELANGLLRNQHSIVQFEKTINATIQGNLTELSRELGRVLGDADLAAALTENQEQRLRQLQKDVNQLINDTYKSNTKDLQFGLSAIAVQTQRLTRQTFADVFTFDITGITLNPQELRALARNPVVLGGKVTENWRKQSGRLKQGLVEQTRLGLAQGETNTQLVNRIIGTPTGARERVIIDGKPRSVRQRAGGIMDVSKREATALVRTSVQTVTNSTLEAIYRENSDVIKGIGVLVTLDSRTSAICMSLSGGMWNLKTGDPLPDSGSIYSWPGPAPYHWNCRTINYPITLSWRDLSQKARRKILDAADKPSAVRAKMNGQALEKQTYPEFLSEQTNSFQNSKLGRTRAELFRSGDLELNQLTDATLTPLTLRQLERVI